MIDNQIDQPTVTAARSRGMQPKSRLSEANVTNCAFLHLIRRSHYLRLPRFGKKDRQAT
jgi:hypothetical protein